MKDCNCESTKQDVEWLNDNEVGDDLLFQEKNPLINSIKLNLNNYQTNNNSIFNKELESEALDNLIIDDTEIDYSYLKDFESEDDTDVESEVVDESEPEVVDESEPEFIEKDYSQPSKFKPLNSNETAKTNAFSYLQELI